MSLESPTPEEYMNPQQTKEAIFEQQNKTMQTILSSDQGWQEYVDQLSSTDKEALFGQNLEIEKSCSCCVDEGIPLDPDQQGRLRIAGSGILLGKERAQQLWQEAGITTVTAHEGCGAAALYCQENNIQTGSSSHYVADILRQWAEEVGLQFEYIGSLDRPEFHTARAVMIDATGTARPNDLPQGPKSFVVTTTGTAQETADDALLSAGIAFGDHGLAELFTPDNPLLIALVGDQDQQLVLQQTVEAIKRDPRYTQNQSRIRIQTAIVPQAQAAEQLAA